MTLPLRGFRALIGSFGTIATAVNASREYSRLSRMTGRDDAVSGTNDFTLLPC